MRLKDVYGALGVNCPKEIESLRVNNVTSNIENISEGTVFVWVRGVGHNTDCLKDKIEEAAPMLVVKDEDRTLSANIQAITVHSPRAALAILCSLFYKIDYSRTRFIAVTGTNGKSSTAKMIFEILKHAGLRVGFIGTGKILCGDKILTDRYYSMTTPPPEVLYPAIKKMQDDGCLAIVMEVSSHALVQKRVEPIYFSFSLFTNLSSEHLDFHKTKEEYYKSKLTLFEQSENGIFNADDEYSARAMREAFDKCNATSVGIVWEAEARAKSITEKGFLGSDFYYEDKERIFKVRLPLVGYYNVYNALMALKCAIDFGIKPYIAKEALEGMSGIDGRFETVNDEITVIIDYAHTPAAFKNVLKAVKRIKKSRQNIIVVFGAGGERDTEKRPKMAEIAEKYASLSILTLDNERGEDGEKIIEDIRCGFTSPDSYKIITPRDCAIREAILCAREGDVVLLLGKGHERYNITREGYTPFDEREVVRAALEERKDRPK